VKNKVTIITAAARGIGAAIAERFLKAEAIVVIADSDSAEAQKTARSLDAAGDHSLVVPVDVTSLAQT
jgi:NAD(P)-dependent dehydrogenase (short-subunit alcohol dehydrogenase family)